MLWLGRGRDVLVRLKDHMLQNAKSGMSSVDATTGMLKRHAGRLATQEHGNWIFQNDE